MTPLTILISGFVGLITFKLANYSASGKHAEYSPKKFDFIIDFFAPYKDTEFFYFGLGFTMTFILMLIRMLIDKIKSTIKILKKNK